MVRRFDTADWLSLVVVVGTASAGVVLWPRLPAEMAIHFSAAGTPDNFVPRPVGIVLVPVIMLGTLLVVEAAGRYDPPEDPQVLAVTKVAAALLLAGMQAFVFSWNLGYNVPYNVLLGGIALWTVALVGYALAADRGSDLA